LALRQAGEMDAASQLRIEGRLAVVRAFEQSALTVTLPTAAARLPFAQRYNNGELSVPEAVRAQVPRTSDSSIERWQRQVRKCGIIALAGACGNRAGTSKIDSTPEVRGMVQEDRKSLLSG